MDCSQTDPAHARNVRVDAFLSQMQRTDRAAVLEAIQQQEVAELERAGIARRIKEARKEAGLSQPEMAEAIGVIPRTYQNYESLKDPRTPWGSMNEIAKVTGKSTEWLIHGSGARTPDPFAEASDGQLDRIEAKLDEVVSRLRRGDSFPAPEGGWRRRIEDADPSDQDREPPEDQAEADGA